MVKIRGNDPALNQPKLRGDCRVLDIYNEGRWQWKTDGSHVTIYDPAANRHEVLARNLFGMSADDWYRYTEDDNMSLPITPSDISDYIKRNIIGRGDLGKN